MTRRERNLWPKIASFSNLSEAFLECRTGKRQAHSTLAFGMGLEGRLFELEGELLNGVWRPDRPREFKVLDPKPRFIQAPTFSDRVVHHALIRHLQPIFERRFISDSYACRRGKGVHASVARLQAQMRQAQGSWGAPWVLKADVAKFFASINHARLIEIIERKIADRRVLDLIGRILGGYGYDGGVGLPVGALTSQLFANVYLDQLDHRVKDELGVRHYVRYMDDFIILAPDKKTLWALHDDLAGFLASDLRLRLNRKTGISPASQGVDFCGYRTFTTHRRPRKRTVKRARQRFRDLALLYRAGAISSADLDPQIASFIGYMKHCNGHRTQGSVMQDIVLTRAAKERV